MATKINEDILIDYMNKWSKKTKKDILKELESMKKINLDMFNKNNDMYLYNIQLTQEYDLRNELIEILGPNYTKMRQFMAGLSMNLSNLFEHISAIDDRILNTAKKHNSDKEVANMLGYENMDGGESTQPLDS